MRGEIIMGKNEQLTFKILQDFRNGVLSRQQAANILGVSEKSITRKARKVREKGLEGLKHGNCGKTPVNKLDPSFKQQLSDLIIQRYFDFNVTHATEMLKEKECVEVAYRSLLRICHEKGLVKRKKRIRTKARAYRERMASEGILLQMDGSHHLWNGLEKWCLIAMIDDATSEIAYAEFFPTEDTLNCLKVLEAVIFRKGIPLSVYVDHAGWFGGIKRQQFSQFTRSAEELGMGVIFANSPEAKGRIERAWQTFQDRLIPELRLYGIKEMSEANTYLQTKFLPDYWNARLQVVPRSATSRYQAVDQRIDVPQICCLKEIRQIRNDRTLLVDGNFYQIETQLLGALKGRNAEIRRYWDGSWAVYFNRICLTLKKIAPPDRLKAYSA